jgi:hypothetical protein
MMTPAEFVAKNAAELRAQMRFEKENSRYWRTAAHDVPYRDQHAQQAQHRLDSQPQGLTPAETGHVVEMSRDEFNRFVRWQTDNNKRPPSNTPQPYIRKWP